MKTVLFIVLLTGFWASAFLDNVLRSISAKELKRRSRRGDRTAGRLYKMSIYGAAASPFLWLVGGLSLGGLIIIVDKWVTWQVIAVALVLALLIWSAKAPKMYSKWLLGLASWIAPLLGWLMGVLQPIIGRFAKSHDRAHTGAYEKEDLLDLIKTQHRQADNRIAEGDLKLALSALQFGDRNVSQVMTPRGKVKWVAQDEPIGPLLMDELHASGFGAFPVVKDAGKRVAPDVVGTLYMKDLVDRAAGGKVKEAMRPEVYFISEACDLREALAALGKTHHHLLIVVNNFEDVVGVLTYDKLLEQVLGQKPTADFEQYHDKSAVAGHSHQAPPAKTEP